MKYFKVKYGFKDGEYLSVDENEVEKALKAQIGGGIVIFKGGSVSGNNIISITPDYNRAMGWNHGYEPHGEDFRYLDEETINSHEQVLLNAKMSLKGLSSGDVIKKLN